MSESMTGMFFCRSKMDKGNFLDEAILIKLQLLDILFQIRMLIFTNMVSVEFKHRQNAS